MVSGVVIVLLLFGLAVIVTTAQQLVITQLRAGTSLVKRWGGAVLIVVGVWTLASAILAGQFARLFPV